MERTFTPRDLLLLLLLGATLLPGVSSGMALGAGLLLALGPGHTRQREVKAWTSHLLTWSVIGLGASMDLRQVIRVGLEGAGAALVSISLCLTLAWVLMRWLRVDRRTGMLVGVGTAICGGSAIAAVAPVIDAEEGETGLALAAVFLLNAVALYLFPAIGHLVHLGGTAFGRWAALGIHDTSSVVGAALAYGQGALDIAAPMKLARALWIVPLTLVLARFFPRQGEGKPARRPWFILGFLGLAALTTALPVLRPAGHVVSTVARHLLVSTLFLVGASLDRATLRRVGVRPLVLAVLLWIALGGASLAAVLRG